MMTSYLVSMSTLPEIVADYYYPSLLHLIRLGFRSVTLKIYLLLDTRFSEDVMTASGSFREAERHQQ